MRVPSILAWMLGFLKSSSTFLVWQKQNVHNLLPMFLALAMNTGFRISGMENVKNSKDLRTMAKRKEKVAARCPMVHTRIGELFSSPTNMKYWVRVTLQNTKQHSLDKPKYTGQVVESPCAKLANLVMIHDPNITSESYAQLCVETRRHVQKLVDTARLLLKVLQCMNDHYDLVTIKR